MARRAFAYGIVGLRLVRLFVGWAAGSLDKLQSKRITVLAAVVKTAKAA
jgi:hypothetical protein